VARGGQWSARQAELTGVAETGNTLWKVMFRTDVRSAVSIGENQ
jgi:hypothetical protein